MIIQVYPVYDVLEAELVQLLYLFEATLPVYLYKTMQYHGKQLMSREGLSRALKLKD